MAEVMAGFVCGFALSIVATPVAAIAVVRARVDSPLMQRIVPKGTNLIAVSVIINVFLLVTCTALGIVLGLMLYGLEDSRPAGGLGSPNRAFTAFILVATAIAVLPVSAVSRRLRLPLIACGLVVIGTFGWFMPYLASWSPIEQ